MAPHFKIRFISPPLIAGLVMTNQADFWPTACRSLRASLILTLFHEKNRLDLHSSMDSVVWQCKGKWKKIIVIPPCIFLFKLNLPTWNGEIHYAMEKCSIMNVAKRALRGRLKTSITPRFQLSFPSLKGQESEVGFHLLMKKMTEP